MRRRTFVSAAGISLLPTTGCLHRGSDDRAIQLSQVRVENGDDPLHEIAVRVHRDGILVHDSTVELRGRDDGGPFYRSVACTWDETPGTFVVAGRLADSAWVTADISEGAETDCVRATVTVLRGGKMRVMRPSERCVSPALGGCIPDEE